MEKLSAKRSRFVEEYLKDFNGSQAAIRAGYRKKSAKEIAARLLTIANIKKAVETGRERISQRVDFQISDIIRELLYIAHLDIRQAFNDDGTLKDVHSIPEATARAISGIDVQETFSGSGPERMATGFIKKIKASDKIRALELLGKYKGMFVERLDVSDSRDRVVHSEPLSDDEWAKKYGR